MCSGHGGGNSERATVDHEGSGLDLDRRHTSHIDAPVHCEASSDNVDAVGGIASEFAVESARGSGECNIARDREE